MGKVNVVAPGNMLSNPCCEAPWMQIVVSTVSSYPEFASVLTMDRRFKLTNCTNYAIQMYTRRCTEDPSWSAVYVVLADDQDGASNLQADDRPAEEKVRKV